MSRSLIYWDSCVFIAWLQDEPQPQEVMDGIADVVAAVDSDKVILVTSTVTLTEVLDCTLTPLAAKQFEDLFKRPNVQQISLDHRIAKLSQQIRSYYHNQAGTKVWTADAQHLATAIMMNCDEFHTLDGFKRDKKVSRLLSLGNVVAGGYPLKICIPPASPQTSLF